MEIDIRSDASSAPARTAPRGLGIIAGAALLAVALLVGGLLLWSTSAVDRVSFDRQQQVVSTVLAESVARVAHDQESVTVWDDSLRQLAARPRDLAWMDSNLGVWMHGYYGHDAVYILDPADRPVYAMEDGRRIGPEGFARVSAALLPMVAHLRATMRAEKRPVLPADVLSPGAAGVTVAGGHPVIASAKPFLSDSGTMPQPPGDEYVHISLRRLDGRFLAALEHGYRFRGARFDWRDDAIGSQEAALAWHGRDGRPLGYFIWTPFVPGSRVFAQFAPGLIAGLLLLGALILALVRRVARRTRQLRESHAAARHLAFHDVLTGLPNRALFDERLGSALTLYRATAEHRVALLYLDIDRFKRVNDTHGHPAGDALIREFARRLDAIVRASDTAARQGGDEFAIIQTEVTAPAQTEHLCQRIVEAASAPFDFAGIQLHVGVSIGVSTAGKDGIDADELTRKADIALYQAKAGGRGCYRFFADTMDAPIRARAEIERDLRAAIAAGGQLAVHYQPQYAAQTGEIRGVEALVRWNHPDKGLILPTAFIAIAEEAGLIEPLGEWVLAEACRAARDWPITTLSVNVSAIQLRHADFAARVLAIVRDSGMDPRRLELEITETALIENAADCAENLRLLRAEGIRFALDDFGTGYSSFSHLREFHVDRIKIDRSFVDKIDLAAGGSAIIQAIVDLARSTGLQVTAEGVETDAQSGFLKGVGCDDLQGYLFARPMTAGQMGALIGAAEARPAPAGAAR